MLRVRLPQSTPPPLATAGAKGVPHRAARGPDEGDLGPGPLRQPRGRAQATGGAGQGGGGGPVGRDELDEFADGAWGYGSAGLHGGDHRVAGPKHLGATATWI